MSWKIWCILIYANVFTGLIVDDARATTCILWAFFSLKIFTTPHYSQFLIALLLQKIRIFKFHRYLSRGNGKITLISTPSFHSRSFELVFILKRIQIWFQTDKIRQNFEFGRNQDMSVDWLFGLEHLFAQTLFVFWQVFAWFYDLFKDNSVFFSRYFKATIW